MTRPLLLAVDPDPESLSRIEQELSRRFGIDFRVRGESDGRAALTTLEKAAEPGRPGCSRPGRPVAGGRARHRAARQGRSLHPDAGRALLVPWGAWADRRTADAILKAMAHGEINYYVLKPWTSPDELFHRTVAEFVQAWSRTVVDGQTRGRRGGRRPEQPRT